MKRSIKGHEEMSHAGGSPFSSRQNYFVSYVLAEIMDILRTKKAQSPPPITNRKRPKVTSAEAIDDSDEDSEGEEVEVEGIVVEPSNQIIHPPIIAAGS